MQDLLVEIFYDVDNYCIAFENYCRSHFLAESSDSDIQIIRSKNLSLSEVMTITIYFHLSNYRNFKVYYTEHVSTVLKSYFPKLVSYNRFVELMQQALIPLLLYMSKFRNGKCTGISFIDSTTLDVCITEEYILTKFLKELQNEVKAQQAGFMDLSFISLSMIKVKFYLSI